MELFDFIKVLFTRGSSEYDKMKDYDKSKFFFMTNRFMGIAYPVQANMFNHIRVNQARTLDYWHRSLTHQYNGVPDWIYTKTKKAAATDAKKAKVPSDEAIQAYLSRNGYSQRQLQDAVKMIGPEATYAPIFKLEKLMKDND